MRKSIILVGILALGFILLTGCRQRPKEVELEKKELIPLEEMVPLEPMAEEAPMVAEAPLAVASTPAAPAAVTGKININTATQAQLESLPRIGPVTAAAIIANRPFSSIEDITRTPRIGPKTYQGLKDLITVGGAAAPAVVPTVAPTVTPTAAPAEPVYKKVDTDGDGIPDTFILYQTAPAALSPTAALPAVAPAAVTGKININTATQAQLESLPRIGPVTAAAIIANRPFSSIEDITRTPRIGPKTYQGLKNLITVGGVAAPAASPTVAPAVAPAAVTGKININTATQAQLESLPRIGPATAAAIIANRPFSSIEDITRTPRIGPKTYEGLKNLITVK